MPKYATFFSLSSTIFQYNQYGFITSKLGITKTIGFRLEKYKFLSGYDEAFNKAA
jgi:hypothetical protein